MISTVNRDLPSVLLVDDEDQILFSSATLLRRASIRNVTTVSDSRKVLPLLAEEKVGTIVLDLFMPHVSGKDILSELCRDYPQVPVIVMTASDDLETAVDCMKKGAFDYLLKPVENARFISCVTKALEIFTLKSQMAMLEEHLFNNRVEQPAAFEAIVTASNKMQTVFQYCEVIGGSRQPVLISGETGTGKELVARAVHTVSRLPGKFVPVNVAGLDDNLFTDTLFGHRKGAYTGAEEARRGLIESAADGTLFLDEIGDLSESSQVKLLRLLQEQEYYSIGSDIPKKSSARIIASTNRDLHQEVSRGAFRRDLYYRICAHRVMIPPLRERPEDIPLLVEHFLRAAAKKLGKRRPSPPAQLCALLSAYRFPGNVRELEAMVFDAVARHNSGILSLASFKEAIGREISAGSMQNRETRAGCSLSYQFPENLPTLDQAETLLVSEAMKRAGGNQGIAASLLGISRSALNKRLKKAG
jgi:DNA-binding NtrC family response regulator